MCRGDLDSFVESGYEIAVATFGDLVSHVSLRPDERVASPFDSAQGEVDGGSNNCYDKKRAEPKLRSLLSSLVGQVSLRPGSGVRSALRLRSG